MVEQNRQSASFHRGFSLIEILVVVVILGVLAAIVFPKFQSQSTQAQATNLVAQLKSVRDQLERYRFEHNDEYPDIVGDGWGTLTGKTDYDHTLNAAGRYGPYLIDAPVNPFTDSNVIAATEVAGNGWYYDLSTGDFYAVGFDETTQTYTAP